MSASTVEQKNVINSNETFLKHFSDLLSDFSARNKKIISARYGIENGSMKTLEEIGKNCKVTRERVRQIINDVMKKVRMNQNNKLQEIEGDIAFTIEKNYGIILASELINQLAGENLRERAALMFIMDCARKIKKIKIKNELKESYVLKDFDFDGWRGLKDEIKKILMEEKKPLTLVEIEKKLIEKNQKSQSLDKLANYLKVSEEISRNSFGKWGLVHWREIKPKNTKEKIYLILKEIGQPLHYTRISQLIDQYGLNSKKTHRQTVHNELIKDEKFVLVGRGVYALKEWGYEKGTVREIIQQILEKKGRPMSRDEILEEIAKVRLVKKSTVLINLNNFFSRTNKNQYSTPVE